MRALLRLNAVLSLLLLAAVAAATAQVLPRPTPSSRRSDYTTEGKEFWVVFQKNFRDYTTDDRTLAAKPADPLQLELFITSSENATGYVEIRGLGFRYPFTVQAGKVISIPIDTAAQVRSSEKIEDLAVHIVADEQIAVYGLNRRYQTTDTYLAHPVNVLGTNYRAMCYAWLQNDLLAQMAIIATQDGTHVTITPSAKTQKGRPAKQPFVVELNRGDVYQVIPRYDPNTKSDLTGTLIESDKPIAVFSGHNCAYVPDPRVKACNLLVEQLPSIKAWGRQFFVGTLAGRSSSVLRVLANEDSTHVFENNKLVATLNAGDFYENKNQTQHTMVTSDRPVLVAQYSKGFDNGDDVGDPMMIIVAPTEQFLTGYRFATPVRGSWHHYINLIVPTTSIGTLRLDEQSLDPRKFKPFGLSLYSIAQIEVGYGTHVINDAEPFGLYSYGFGYDDAAYDAYGNGGGQSMEQVIILPDTIAPELTTNYVRVSGRENIIPAIVRDDRLNDKGVDQVIVDDNENMLVSVQRFEPGAPQVPVTLTMITPKQNAYARLKLRDKAGNVSIFTVCAKYQERGDSMMVTLLRGNRSCDFSSSILFGGLFKYLGGDNNVEIPANSAPIGNPVVLRGNHGQPMYGFAAIAEQRYSGDLYFTGRAGFDIHVGNLFGYWPDSSGIRAADGTVVQEEFHLHRVSVALTLSPGMQYYFAERKAYAFGLLNVSVPLITSETLTRTVLSPGDYVYPNGTGTQEMYDGGGPSGLALVLAPEMGLGAQVELPNGWRVFGEMGLGFTLTSISPSRDWTMTYAFGRGGVKFRF